MTEAEKQRAGFATLVHACDALKAIVDRSELEPITVIGDDAVDGYRRQVIVPPEESREIFRTVLNTLRQACDQGAKLGLPPVEQVRRSSIIIPSQEFRP